MYFRCQEEDRAAKRKGYQVLCDWSQSISNHMYYCTAESNGSGELLQQMWSSILNHVVDIHKGHGSLYPKCQHEQLDDRAWIKKGKEKNIHVNDTLTCLEVWSCSLYLF